MLVLLCLLIAEEFKKKKEKKRKKDSHVYYVKWKLQRKKKGENDKNGSKSCDSFKFVKSNIFYFH